MRTSAFFLRKFALVAGVAAGVAGLSSGDDTPLILGDIDVRTPPVAEMGVRIDYDIVYVRAPRDGDKVHKRYFTDFASPVTLEPGADLILLKPDGTEEVLAEGGRGSITDPVVSFDGEWVYYVLVHDLVDHNRWTPPAAGSDIYKIHLPTRRVVRLTNQQFTPNTGAAEWSSDFRSNEEGKTHFGYGVFNMGPCPLPGGRLAFTSNRDGFRPSRGYPPVALQLFVMDDRDSDVGRGDPYPNNITKIGYLSNACALHPVVLRDGRIMFSSLESQGIRGEILWGVWTIRPDGTGWDTLVSAFDPGGAPNGFHFQTQLSDGSVVVEGYYNQNNSGFGMFVKLPAPGSRPGPAFGPAFMRDPRNVPWRVGRHYNGKPRWYRMPFMPAGAEAMTPFAAISDMPADPSVLADKESPAVGKVTHPSGAPDNHLLCAYSPGPANHQYEHLPQIDSGIYVIPSGEVAEQPSGIALVKNDPAFNECWPRAVVPYRRIYGVDEPAALEPLANDGTASPHLPEGTPFGLVGSSSLYKRESFPEGVVPEGGTASEWAADREDAWKGLDAFTSHGNGMPINWHNQGADAGLYENDDIHAVRILAMEPTTDRHRGPGSGVRFYNHAEERLRILGEIPVRKFAPDGTQPKDPDGNPDTSFLAKLPADTPFTFQTIDKEGMVLHMAQTWHQLRPGEVRNNCGGCHAHSQEPTDFAQTLAAKDDYQIWDLVNRTPLVTGKPVTAVNGLRPGPAGAVDVEYHRDIRPILDRSCVACHTKDDPDAPAGLVLDADDEEIAFRHQGKFPGSYYRLALDEGADFGHKPPTYDSWGYPQASRYIRKFQSRRSLIVWKLYGERLDGFDNDDHPSESEPGAGDLVANGVPVDKEKNRARYDIDFTGDPMPPPDAVRDGTVAALSDEDRRTIVRWIDLGCPIDLDHGAEADGRKGFGWMADDLRPTLTLSQPAAGTGGPIRRLVVGAYDYGSGIEEGSLRVTANVEVGGVPAGENLAPRLGPLTQGVYALELDAPVPVEEGGPVTLDVSVRDRQGNVTRVVRTLVAGRDVR